MELRKRQKQKKKKFQKTIERWADNFIEFAQNLKVIAKNNELIRVQPSPILLAFEKARTGRDYVLKPRQVFMTTWELARDIWYFITKPGSNVVILCQSDKENSLVKEISNRIVTMLESLTSEFPELPIRKISDTKWVLINENRKVSGQLLIGGAGATEKAASKKFRGFRISRLHVTEVAFFEYAIETLTGILNAIPSVENGTEVTFESTPNGASGAFYDGYMAAKDGKSEFKAHFYRWFEQEEYQSPLKPDEEIIPQTEREKQLVQLYHLKPEQIKWYRQKVNDPNLGQGKVDQEFPSDEETCWLFDGRLFFDRDALHKLRTTARPPENRRDLKSLSAKFGGNFGDRLRVWFQPEVGKTYILVIDPSSGVELDTEEAKKKKLDPSAIVVIEREAGKYCATITGFLPPEVVGEYAAQLGAIYNWALIVIERSSSWQSIHTTLTKWKRPPYDDPNSGFGYPNIYADADRQVGFYMSRTARPAVLDAFEIAVRTGVFVTYDLELVKEMQLFVVIDDKPQAAAGAHDDRIIASAIAYKLTQISLGLHHKVFGSAPSIAFDRTPISFDGIKTGADVVADVEMQRWARNNEPPAQVQGWSLIYEDKNGTEGF